MKDVTEVAVVMELEEVEATDNVQKAEKKETRVETVEVELEGHVEGIQVELLPS